VTVICFFIVYLKIYIIYKSNFLKYSDSKHLNQHYTNQNLSSDKFQYIIIMPSYLSSFIYSLIYNADRKFIDMADVT
jgi:hypothetical protein